MKRIILCIAAILSGCAIQTETTTSDGFMVAYGKLEIEVLVPDEVKDEVSISFEDKEGGDLPSLGNVSRSDDGISVSINSNWGREFGNTEECLFFNGEKYCRNHSRILKFEEFLVIGMPNSPEKRYKMSDLKDCMTPGLICKNLLKGGRVVTLDVAVVPH